MGGGGPGDRLVIFTTSSGKFAEVDKVDTPTVRGDRRGRCHFRCPVLLRIVVLIILTRRMFDDLAEMPVEPPGRIEAVVRIGRADLVDPRPEPLLAAIAQQDGSPEVDSDPADLPAR